MMMMMMMMMMMILRVAGVSIDGDLFELVGERVWVANGLLNFLSFCFCMADPVYGTLECVVCIGLVHSPRVSNRADYSIPYIHRN